MIGEVLLLRAQRGIRFTMECSSQSSFYSAYELLIHHLPSLYPHEAQWWSRAKAYTNQEISPSMWGLMKVAGKRLYFLSQQELEDLWSTVTPEQGIHFSQHELEAKGTLMTGQLSSREKALNFELDKQQIRFTDYQEAVSWLESKHSLYNTLFAEQDYKQLTHQPANPINTSKVERRWYGPKRIVVAMALDHKLRLIAVRFNQPKMGHSAHAERRLLEYIWQNQQGLEFDQLTLISSLKPCKMCAGLWLSHCPHQNLDVIYLHDDPGPNGQNTAFDQDSYAYLEASKWPKTLKSFRQKHWLVKPSSS